MAMRTFILVLVRHGQTAENKLKILQGQMETQLTELGRDQARLLRDYFKKNGSTFDQVYCSDLKRAHDTCIIALDNSGDIKTNKLLRERSFGLLQGSPLEQLRAEAAKAGYDDSNYTQFRPEGGELIEEVHQRIVKFCEEELYVNAKPNSTVLVVTHGGVVREFMKYFMRVGCPIPKSQLYVTPNTSMNTFEIELTADSKVSSIKIKSLHDIPHLTQEAKSAALSEEQLNESGQSTKARELAGSEAL